MVHRRLAVVAALLVSSTTGAVWAQTWSNAQLLNDPSEGAPYRDIKEPAICAAASGGFHAVYRYFAPEGVRIEYRRYQAGNLSPVRIPHVLGFLAGGDICEAGNGAIHVVWENWDDTPDIGWTMSSNGGINWTTPTEITHFTDTGKIPLLAAYGSASGGQVVMSCGKANGKVIWYNVFNGSSWAGYGAATQVNYGSEYEIFGMTRSLQDGTVYRASDWGSSLIYMRYNGSTWSTNDASAPGNFFPRQSIAVNPSGQVMIVWETDDEFWSRVYTPGSGWNAVAKVADKQWSGGHTGHGSVTAIPGSNDFYAAYNRDMNRIRGKRWNGSWPADSAEETISVNQPSEFTVSVDVCAGADGSLYAAWEYWGNDYAQAWYSVKAAGAPPPSGTISGVVRNQYGTGLVGAAVTTSGAAATTTGAGGNYSLALPVGTYFASANKDYYTGQTIPGVVVTQGQTTTVNFTITGQPPAVVSSLEVVPGNTSNSLSWQNPSSANYTGTMIRFATGAAPADPTQGQLLVNQAGSPNSQGTFNHTGLTNGVRYYYSAFSYWTDTSTYYASAKTGSATPAIIKADYDHDGDVDQSDFSHMQTCLSGSFIPQTIPSCENTKFDQDDDVDEADLSAFLNCFSGSKVYADPDCGG